MLLLLGFLNRRFPLSHKVFDDGKKERRKEGRKDVCREEECGSTLKGERKRRRLGSV